MSNKIIIVTPEFGNYGGGLSFSAFRFAKYFESRNIECKIIISTRLIDNNYPLQKSSDLIYSTIKVADGGYNKILASDLYFRGSLNNILFKLQGFDVDVIIAFGAGFNGLFASQIATELGVKFIVMPRGSEVNLAISNSKLYHANYLCMKSANSVISVSNELQSWSKKIYFNPKTEYLVIPNYIEFETIDDSQLSKSNQQEFIIGTGAKHLNEKKGISNLIETTYYLNKLDSKKYQIRLVGEIDEELLINYKKQIASLEIDEFIVFLGPLNREEYLNEIGKWDLAIQSSFCEGFSNSIGDAISKGLPFMITNTGFIAETLLKQFPEVILFNISPCEMASKIADNLNNINFKTLIKSAITSLKSVVNKEHVYLLWDNIFNSAINKIPNYAGNKINNICITTLLLHDIGTDSINGIEITVSKLEELCCKIQSSGYILCSAETYFKSDDTSNLVICTFDDGYSGVIKYAFPVMKKFGFTATVFVCSDYINTTNNWNKKDKMNRRHLSLEELLQLKENEWEIGSHGTNHISFNRLDENEILNNLLESKIYLSKYFLYLPYLYI